MELEFLNKIRNNFYLSNYSKVLDIWKEVFNSEIKISEELKSEFLTIIQRCILKYFKNDEEIYNQNTEYFSICSTNLELYLNFLAPLISEISKDNNLEILNTLENLDDNLDDNLDYQIIYNHVCFNLQKYDKMISISNKYPYSYLEYKTMIIRGFLNNNQIEEAKRKLDEIKNIEDDDIIIDLVETEYFIKIEDFNSCLELCEEIREKHGDSGKILNLIGFCLMNLNNFDKAYEILIKLYNLLKNKLKDNTELEICIKNLISLNILLNKTEIQNKVLIQELSELSGEDNLLNTIADINEIL